MKILILLSLLFLSACQNLKNQHYELNANKEMVHKSIKSHSTDGITTINLKLLLAKLGVTSTVPEFTYLQKLVAYEQNKLERNRFVQRSLQRGARYIPYIQTQLKDAGLPSEFVYLALIESGFKTSAKSHKGAKGVWQIMPRTAVGLGLPSSQRNDVVKSTKAAIKYIKSRYAVFGNKPLLVAASYNIGEGGISSRLRKLNDPFARSFIAIHHKLPKETKDYVPRWLAATLIANKLIDSLHYKNPNTIIITNKPYKINSLLKSMGITKNEFNKNNPEYTKHHYLKAQHNFIVLNNYNVTPNIDGLFLTAKSNYTIQTLNENSPTDVEYKKYRSYRKPKAKYTKIKVNRGMTFSHLQQWFGLSRSQLEKHNSNLKHGLRSGSNINIPSNKLTVKRYKVRSGDTLGKIAQKHKISLSKLKLSNGLKKSRIYIGQKLTIVLPA